MAPHFFTNSEESIFHKSKDTLIKSILPPLGDVFSRGRIDGYAFNQRVPKYRTS